VRGPNITPGYWQPGGTIAPIELDGDGFLPTGDAGRLEDEREPAAGVVFDGRLAENFKLSTGTWVCVGELRVAVVGACAPAIQDAVIAGHDRDEVTAILFPGRALDGAALREHVRAALARHNAAQPGRSATIARALIADPG